MIPNKKTILLLGLLTLFVFPIPVFVIQYFVNDYKPLELFMGHNFEIPVLLFGVFFGISYALIIEKVTSIKSIKSIFEPQNELIKSLNLKPFQYIFLSICAGVGEELLFRFGIQPFIGLWPTTFLFIGVHGYFSLKTVEGNFPGMILLPFVAILGIGYIKFGIWFCILAHFSYDLITFHLAFRFKKSEF